MLVKVKSPYFNHSLGRLSKEEAKDHNTGAFVGSTEYGYDIRNNLTSLITNYGGKGNKQQYFYTKVAESTNSAKYQKDNLPTMYKLNDNIYAIYRYGTLNRYNQRQLVIGTNANLYYNYIYKVSDRNAANESKYRTTQIAEEYIGNDVYIYGYDVLENITSIKKATRSTAGSNETSHTTAQDYVSYKYDDLGQLTRENLAGKKTSVWNYDELGNITSKSEYAYTTVEDLKNETVNKTVKYYYPDDKITYQDSTKTTKTYSSWNNILVAVDLDGSNDVANNEIIEYDQIGNPTSYLGATLKWNGRQLTSYKTSDKEISYTYDSNGLRTSKTIKNGVKSEYFYVNGQLHYEERSNGTKLYFFYDSNGYLTGIEYNNTMYYPATNRRGDVVAIYNSVGNCIVKYEYDAWGNVIDVVDNSGINLAEINPIRYRGYYYDTETKLYYLQSRYYNPEVGRFLNSDSISDSGAGVLGYNTFIYCANNPVMKYDPTGHFGLVSAMIATGAIVGGLLGGLSAASTGGNVVEGVVEGVLTGALGAACGILIPNPIVAVGLSTLGGATIDFATQVVTQSVKSKSMDFSNVDYGRVVKTGIQTGLGTAVPALGDGAGNAVDAFGTALIWAEASTVITCADIIITNTIESFSKDVTTRQDNGENKKSETIILFQE